MAYFGRTFLSKNEFAALLYRVAQAVALLICFRIIMIDYGANSYGLVSLLLSGASYLTFLDFGVVSHMRSELPGAYYLHGARRANAIALQGLKALFFYTLSLYAVIFVVLTVFGQAMRLVRGPLARAPDLSAPTLQAICITVGAYSVLVVLSNLTQAILSARGMQYRLFFLLTAGCALQIAAVATGAYLQLSLSTLFAVLVISGMAVALPMIAGQIREIIRNHDPQPGFRALNRTSSAFFIIQLQSLTLNPGDTLLAAHFFSLRDVAIYATMKLVIQLPFSLHANYIAQAWPLYSAKRAAADWDGVRAIFRDRLSKTLIVISPICVGIVLFAPPLISLWSKGSLQVPIGVAAALAALLFVYTLNACFGTLIFAFQYIAAVAWSAPLLVVVYYAVASALSAHLGISAIAIASIVAQGFTLSIGVYFYLFVLGRTPRSDRHREAEDIQ